MTPDGSPGTDSPGTFGFPGIVCDVRSSRLVMRTLRPLSSRASNTRRPALNMGRAVGYLLLRPWGTVGTGGSELPKRTDCWGGWRTVGSVDVVVEVVLASAPAGNPRTYPRLRLATVNAQPNQRTFLHLGSCGSSLVGHPLEQWSEGYPRGWTQHGVRGSADPRLNHSATPPRLARTGGQPNCLRSPPSDSAPMRTRAEPSP